jgi:stearoyl-CoA desaturase (delta-9 desaturase)
MNDVTQPAANHPITAFFRHFGIMLRQWLDSDYHPEGVEAVRAMEDKVDWKRTVPFIIIHFGCLLVLWVGFSWFALGAALFLYGLRMFAITAFYHRYFSHRTFRTSRVGQFLFAVLGNSAMQRGPLWWASVHRHHHHHSDESEDVHSPRWYGFWWSHIGWITSRRNFPTDYSRVKDLAAFPELKFLNRHDQLVPVFYGVALWVVGAGLERWLPGLGTNGAQLFVWGFFISTVFLLHATFCINSLAHVLGKKRFATKDDSRNNLFLALLTLGEGWHNNHHRYAFSARQGFLWWEIDVSYYLLKMLSWTGLIWDLRPVPKAVYAEIQTQASEREGAR